ncbi:MAG: helix-turn-helix transcriptional regulator [Clostridia bacterium]|nr:helix-turn-helix transcriptional regulator [Clostridia bacterium]
MDIISIGKFIKEQRKAKGLTQNELASKLMISEKTVSKWECGNGLPDATLMIPLCTELNISANELLSGRKLSSEEYKQQAEHNLFDLKQKQEQTAKFLLAIECVLGYITSISFFIFIFIASYFNIPLGWRIALIVIGILNFFVGIHFCLKIEKDAGFYECNCCHNKYIPTYNQVLWSMHFGRTRYMKCSKCNKTSWNKKVIK